jgi:dephospho-CoA kinase
MIVLAGPIASGKTTHFRQVESILGIDSFNVDDRSAELNGGSYQNISRRDRGRPAGVRVIRPRPR